MLFVFAALAVFSAHCSIIPLAAHTLVAAPVSAHALVAAPAHTTLVAEPLAARTVVAGPSGTVVSDSALHGVPLALSAPVVAAHHVW